MALKLRALWEQLGAGKQERLTWWLRALEHLGAGKASAMLWKAEQGRLQRAFQSVNEFSRHAAGVHAHSGTASGRSGGEAAAA